MPGAFLGPSPLYLLCPGARKVAGVLAVWVAGLPGRPPE